MTTKTTLQHPAAGAGSRILTEWRAQREAARAQSRGGAWHAPAQGARLLAAPPTRALRGFMAASNDRLVSDMMSTLGLVSGNAEVRMSLRQMRLRSRQLSNDNEYVKRFLQLLRNNVVGPRGFGFQSKIYKRNGTPDADANNTIEEAFKEFSKLGTYTADKRYSRATFERAVINNCARDGEVIIEKLYGKRFNRFGMAYRLIDPDLLDDQLNVGAGGAIPGYGALDQGNSIRMGVEIDAYGAAVYYWFHSTHPGDDVGHVAPARHRRVPADRIIHWYLAEDLRPDTVRGVPWIYAAIRRMAMLGGYEEAALVNARNGASKMGFYKPPAPDSSLTPPIDGTALADNQDEAARDPAADLYQEAEPGVFGVLPAGWDFQTYDPAYPNDAMEGFIAAMLRAFSSSVGLTYNILGNDLRGVNLSTMRFGAMNDRDTYESLQGAMKEAVVGPMFEEWLSHSLAFGQVGRLPPDAFDRLNKPRFIPRPWRSTDPQKDIAADAQAVALGVTSRHRICADRGEDFEEVLDELASEEAMAREKGVTLNTHAASQSKNPKAVAPAKPDDPDDQGEPEEGASNAGNDDET
jgi:lambda family phage portal protein